MMRLSMLSGAAVVVAAILLQGTGAAVAAEKACSTDHSQDFVRLYNGKDLTGWAAMDGKIESWLADGELLSSVVGKSGWLRTTKTYSDFILRLEFRIPPNGNSGIGLRFPQDSNPAFGGMEIQILDDDADQYKNLKDNQYNGSIYAEVAAKRGALKPTGKFNRLVITCKGPHVSVVLNDRMITEANLDEFRQTTTKYKPLADRPRSGFIGLQNHGSRVDFRNVEIKDLTKTVSDSHQGGIHTRAASCRVGFAATKERVQNNFPI